MKINVQALFFLLLKNLNMQINVGRKTAFHWNVIYDLFTMIYTYIRNPKRLRSKKNSEQHMLRFFDLEMSHFSVDEFECETLLCSSLILIFFLPWAFQVGALKHLERPLRFLWAGAHLILILFLAARVCVYKIPCFSTLGGQLTRAWERSALINSAPSWPHQPRAQHGGALWYGRSALRCDF